MSNNHLRQKISSPMIIFTVLIVSVNIVLMISSTSSSKNQLHKNELSSPNTVATPTDIVFDVKGKGDTPVIKDKKYQEHIYRESPDYKVESLTAEKIKTIGISEALDIPDILKHFPVSEIYKGRIPQVQLSSHPRGKEFRTRLREAAKKGPNFAGHYTIVRIGCGTNCQNIWIIDSRSGKILEGPYNTSWGAEYNLNSRLLILNPLPLDVDKSDLDYSVLTCCDSTYMLMDQGNFKILFKEKMGTLLQERLNRS